MLVILFLSLLSSLSATSESLFDTRLNDVTSKYEDYRLPNTTIPSKYDINLNIPEEALTGGNTSYSGTVNISFHVSMSTDKIVLHSLVDINNVSLSTPDSIAQIVNTTVNKTRETITILTATNLTANIVYNLYIHFNASLEPVNMVGFYRSEYTVANNTQEYLATTQFESTEARKAFPCFDEPGLKAVFSLTLQHPVGFEAVANTPVLSNSPTATSITTSFQDTPIMSTYLLAFTISKFVCKRNTVNGIPLGVCSRSHFENDTSLALEYGGKVLEALDALTGFPYNSTNIGKMDQFAIPDFSAGAMENWGLVNYREYLLIYNPEYTSNLYKQRMFSVIAHEFTHMWFGNLVTLQWWSYTFLNEGFARYFQYFLLDKINDTQNYEIEKQFIIEQQQTAFIVDSYSSSKSLTSEAFTPKEISDKFGSISYNKGASVIRMVKNVIGATGFQTAIQKYLANNNLSSTTPEILWNTFSNELLPDGLNFTQVIDAWTYKPGFPVIFASLDGKNVVLSQKRFSYNTSFSDSTQWYVPINYMISNGSYSTDSIWLLPNSTITLDAGNSTWLIINHNSSGYYRVHYDSSLRTKLVRALLDNDPQITDINRAQILDDMLNLARGHYVKYSEVFQFVQYLKNETSYYPWYTAIRGLNYLIMRFGLESTLGQRIAGLLLEQFVSVSANVSHVDLTAVGHVDSLKWPMLWSTACKLGHTTCIDEAKKQYKEFINGTNINPNIRDVVYCNALRYSDDSKVDWDILWKRLHNVDQPQETLYILMALGCTKNKDLLSYYLDQSINSSSIIRVQDVATVWSAVYSSSSVGLQVALEKFISNHSDIVKYYSGGITILAGIADRITTEAQVSQLQNLLNQQESNSTLGKAVKSALDSSRENLKWQSSIRNDLQAYFGIVEPSSATSFGVSMMLLVVSLFIVI